MTEEADEEETDSIPLSDLRSDLGAEESGAAEFPDGKKPDSTELKDPEPSQEDKEAGSEAEASDSIPLSGLRDEVDRQSSEAETVSEDATGSFVEETVEPVDSEGVWADLLMDDEHPEGHFAAVEAVPGAEGVTQVISKRICERCEYLDKPPTLQCTHDGTTIHELVDVDHVRVSDCPMVGPDGEKKTEGSISTEET
ncbi:hypothetical protein [Halodesulfurarchaeum sp.]|uniref:hypothetical protein n=1 Tax=Halodesulfurarchaeum sp. TaxID=1980530 RepID=UPI002FC3C30C